MNNFRGNLAAARRLLLTRAGNRCSFPGCGTELTDSNGAPVAEICHIEAISSGGPRFNPDRSPQKNTVDRRLADTDNLIVLCSNHHRLVDFQPEDYSVEWLKAARDSHEASVAAAASPKPDLKALAKKITSFHSCLDTWNANFANDDEEFWHCLFQENPKLLAQAVPNCIIQIADKCYVGGKGLTNRGGKVVDFIYATKSTQNVVIVEIKTPKTKLLGGKYRSGVFSISEDVTGSIVQVLTYRNSLIKNFHAIRAADPSFAIETFDPICVVLAGNLELEKLSSDQRASLDLFRANAGILIMTYDELFAKIKDLVEMLDEDAGAP